MSIHIFALSAKIHIFELSAKNVIQDNRNSRSEASMVVRI